MKELLQGLKITSECYKCPTKKCYDVESIIYPNNEAIVREEGNRIVIEAGRIINCEVYKYERNI